jgi:hypothetical protein
LAVLTKLFEALATDVIPMVPLLFENTSVETYKIKLAEFATGF